MYDPFEGSPWGLPKASAPQLDDDARLGWMLKTVSHQVSAGGLFSLMRHWLQALIIGISNGLLYLTPVFYVSTRGASSADKAK